MPSNILNFSGTIAATTPTDREIDDLEDRIAKKDAQLERWRYFGEEVKRRVDPHHLPFDLSLDLDELLRGTD